MLGGALRGRRRAHLAQEVDAVDPPRAPAVRGHQQVEDGHHKRVDEPEDQELDEQIKGSEN